jgi:integrase
MREEQTQGVDDPATRSIDMLKAVVQGKTYDAVAADFGLTRTAVERRVKSVAVQLTQVVGVDGLRPAGAAFVRRLRLSREAILEALERFEPPHPTGERAARVLLPAEVAQGAVRIKGRSNRPWHDLSLYYLLFATGLRPLEVARLEVRDYLAVDGNVRRETELRAAVAINGKARPLYFGSNRLNDALAAYLRERQKLRHGVGEPEHHRGLDPDSRLFLTTLGEPYPIMPNGEVQQKRFVCRALLETYRKLFRYADIPGLCTQSARLTLMSRMYERGADEDQVGEVLGIADRSAVREQLARPRPALAQVLDEMV